jgi:hypothetical protein
MVHHLGHGQNGLLKGKDSAARDHNEPVAGTCLEAIRVRARVLRGQVGLRKLAEDDV